MGSKRPRDFTHSKRKPTRLKRKSVTSKPSKLHTAADVLRDGIPATELHEIRRRLELILSCTQVVGFALSEQNCQLDIDAARILGRHVTDALHVQIMKLDRLLGRDVDEDDIEEGEGEVEVQS